MIVRIGLLEYATVAGSDTVYHVKERLGGNAYMIDLSDVVTDAEILRLYWARVKLTPAELNRY
jgi:hypothetical protein